jgi:eukaryotic-like serine/threonine-protein kinase
MNAPDRLNTALADRYRIERELGAGGMATVYLAHDIRHDRDVAIKVLHPDLGAALGADRFLTEIKTTAKLQHPHILPLLDSGNADGLLYYVMPVMTGETLRGRLEREKQLPIADAVRIAREVASALDYAHRQGVIHRDIKPENVLLHDGQALVADFGIALAVQHAAGGRMTQTGLSLGTPSYMSPEQAMGERTIDARSDIYALGAMTYEMLAGDPPFTGSTVQAIVARVLSERPTPVRMLRDTVPPAVEHAVMTALAKLPADRFETAGKFAEALANPAFANATFAGTAGLAVAPRGSRRALYVTSAVAVLAIIAAILGWIRRSPVEPLRRFDLSFGAVTKVDNNDVAISPDGTMLAMSGTVGNERAIYLRHLHGDPEFRKLAGTETGYSPAFSPDNQWIVFRKTSDRSLVKISVNGGGAVTLVPAGKLDPYGPHWGTDDLIVFTGPTGAFRIAATGGEPVAIPKVSGRLPFLLPDGSGVLWTSGGNVVLYDFESDSSVALIPGGRQATFVPTGHILYTTPEGGLFAVPFDLAQHRVLGAPVRVLERVGVGTEARGYSVSVTGVLVQHDVAGGATVPLNRLVIVDPGRGADTVAMAAGRRAYPRFSPDGRWIAMEVTKDASMAQTDIYTLDLVTGTYTQLTSDGDNDSPVWSADGKRILFDKSMGGAPPGRVGPPGEDLFIKPADASAPERRLTTISTEMAVTQWVDDRTLLFDARMPGRSFDVFTVSADSGSAPVPYLQSPFSEEKPSLSPDRKLLAFMSNETGTATQVWLRDFPVPQGKWNISRGPGGFPRWSPDGRFVYFWRQGIPDTLFRARIDRTPSVVVQAPEVVATIQMDGIQHWDLHPDGRRFVVAIPVGETAATQGAPAQARHLILQNWFGELRRLTAKATATR